MRDAIGVIFLVEGDGRLGPSDLCRGGEGVDNVHLLLVDVALTVGFMHLGAPEDHEAALSLRELVVFILGAVRRVAYL
jgi:hypothetical protein